MGVENVIRLKRKTNAFPVRTNICFLRRFSQMNVQFVSFLQTLFAENTEVGKLYELVVTNHSGLYRYRLGDVVKIARFHNSCPVVEFQYRQGQILNVRAEKTSERVFYDALTSALSGNGQRFQLLDYTCAESVMLGAQSQGDDVKGVAPYYAVFIELSHELEEEQRKRLELTVGFSDIFRSFDALGLSAGLGGCQMYGMIENEINSYPRLMRDSYIKVQN